MLRDLKKFAHLKNWAKDIYRDLQKKLSNRQYAAEKCLLFNIISHQRNANYNYNMMPLHFNQRAKIKILKMTISSNDEKAK